MFYNIVVIRRTVSLVDLRGSSRPTSVVVAGNEIFYSAWTVSREDDEIYSQVDNCFPGLTDTEPSLWCAKL